MSLPVHLNAFGAIAPSPGNIHTWILHSLKLIASLHLKLSFEKLASALFPFCKWHLFIKRTAFDFNIPLQFPKSLNMPFQCIPKNPDPSRKFVGLMVETSHPQKRIGSGKSLPWDIPGCLGSCRPHSIHVWYIYLAFQRTGTCGSLKKVLALGPHGKMVRPNFGIRK